METAITTTTTTETNPNVDQSGTPDVLLRLLPAAAAAEEEQGQNVPALLLHSQVLRRSEFFEARLSERWSSSSSSELFEICFPYCSHPLAFLKCIRLMYSPHKPSVSCIQDALDLLPVSSHLLFHDCTQACLDFLESVPWTPQQEIDIRSCISSLHLHVSPDLAARLFPQNVPERAPVDIMKDVLGELLSLVSNGAPQKARDITDRVLQANVQASASPTFASVNEMALLKELHNNLDLLKSQLRKFASFFSWSLHQVQVASSALRWLLDELFVLQIADIAVKIIAEEEDLAQLMVSRIYQNPFTETLFRILVRMLRALQSGEVIISRSVRLTLVRTWLPVVAKLSGDFEDLVKDNELRFNLEEGLCVIVGTLPVVDQEEIFKIWIGTCLNCKRAWPDLSAAFDSWCNKLRQVQQVQDNGGGSSLVDNTNITNIERELQMVKI